MAVSSSYENTKNFFAEKPVLCNETQNDLVIAAKAGCEESRTKLFFHNTRLLMKIVKDFRFSHVDEDDMFQQCYVFMLEAFEKYEVNENASFSSYLYTFVRNKLMYFTRQNYSMVSLPDNKKLRKMFNNIKKHINVYDDISGEVLAHLTNVFDVSEREVFDMINFMRSDFYIGVSEDNDTETEEGSNAAIWSELGYDHDYVHEVSEPKSQFVEKLLSNLVETQKRCVVEYYFNDKTLREIAEQENCSHQAIDLRIKNAFKKIRGLYDEQTIAECY